MIAILVVTILQWKTKIGLHRQKYILMNSNLANYLTFWKVEISLGPNHKSTLKKIFQEFFQWVFESFFQWIFSGIISVNFFQELFQWFFFKNFFSDFFSRIFSVDFFQELFQWIFFKNFFKNFFSEFFQWIFLDLFVRLKLWSKPLEFFKK